MQILSATTLLGVWERGLNQSAVQKALGLLAAATPEASITTLAELSIGQRDGLLLTLREWTFGAQIQSVATCPQCSDRLELSFNVSDIQVPTTPQISLVKPKYHIRSRLFRHHRYPTNSPHTVKFKDYEIQFKLPNSLDLVDCLNQLPALNSGEGGTSPQKMLLERCISAIQHRGRKQEIEQLPPEVINAVVSQMAIDDPQANIQLNLSCPSCNHQWRSHFDIVSFFWSEIHAWAIRTLQEVHTIAAAYSWREADILAMNPYRRRLYLEMLRQ
jgi:T4 bacteriophage base plate protein